MLKSLWYWVNTKLISAHMSSGTFGYIICFSYFVAGFYRLYEVYIFNSIELQKNKQPQSVSSVDLKIGMDYRQQGDICAAAHVSCYRKWKLLFKAGDFQVSFPYTTRHSYTSEGGNKKYIITD